MANPVMSMRGSGTRRSHEDDDERGSGFEQQYPLSLRLRLVLTAFPIPGAPTVGRHVR